jgi:Tol biopolymer transport system component
VRIVFEAGIGGTDFLGNTVVEGELLAERLARGTPPPAVILRYAIEIGTILTQAHNRGEVHGALSPYAVMLTENGARVLQPPEQADPRDAPYRSPEQVRGEPADARSDVFAFGAVLYRMLAGRPAFGGVGPELDREILEHTPAALLAHEAIPAAMEGVIAGCLEKDASRRRQRIQNAVTELKLAARALPAIAGFAALHPRGAGSQAALPAQRQLESKIRPLRLGPGDALREPSLRVRRRFGAWLGLLVAGLILAAAVGVLGAKLFWGRREPPFGVKFTVTPPVNASYPSAPSVSPDGRYLTFSAVGPSGARMLWLRPLDSDNADPIAGTEGGSEPFWSPDGLWIAFFADQSLKKIRIPGGALQTICKTEATSAGGSWNREGTILFAPGISGGLFRVSANGGTPQIVVKPDAGHSERAHLWPQFLPDGSHFLFFVLSETEASSGVYAAALDGSRSRRILTADTNAVYAPGDGKGHLLFLREDTLVAQPFDPVKLSLEGETAEVAKQVSGALSLSLSPVSVSDNGVLAYQSLGDATRQLLWVDRSGKQLAEVRPSGEWGPVRVSPDGKRAAAARLAPGQKPGQKHADLWLIDSAGNTSQLTNTIHEDSPVWSPDGSRLVFFGAPEGSYGLFVKPATPDGKVDLLFSSPFPKYPTDWTRDGRYIVFWTAPAEARIASGTGSDLWAYSIAERRATPILQTVYAEAFGAVSPDGKWLAYQSDESETNEIYVQPFVPGSSDTKRRWQVSSDGGALPRWRGDGGELFYMAKDGALMAVATQAGGGEFQAGQPHVLFRTRPLPSAPYNLFDVTPDGQRFLVNLPMEWSSAAPIKVAMNWASRLRN